jgi:hypothetical protein
MSHDVFIPVTTPWSQVGMKKDLTFTPSLPAGLAVAGHTLRHSSARLIPSGAGIRFNLRYTPAWVMNNIDPKRECGGYTLDWWTDTAIFNYDALMVSAFYGIEIGDFREHYKIPRGDFLFITDSGGFQLSRHDVTLSPTDILKWMERNADVGLTLDDPPTPEERAVLTLDLLKPHGKVSRRNYEIMHRSRESDKFELLKVIQGDTVEQLEWWWNLMADLEFDGASIACRPPTAEKTAMGLGFMMHHDMKKVHVLLGTGDMTIPVIIYAKKYFERLTVDSSSFSTAGAAYRTYYLPYSRSMTINFGDNFNSSIKELPCDCPVCQLATVDDLNISKRSHATKDASLPGGLIALHNLYVTLQYYNFLQVLADDRDLYIKHLELVGATEAIKGIEFLDDVYERGFYDAIEGPVDVGRLFA